MYPSENNISQYSSPSEAFTALIQDQFPLEVQFDDRVFHVIDVGTAKMHKTHGFVKNFIKYATHIEMFDYLVTKGAQDSVKVSVYVNPNDARQVTIKALDPVTHEEITYQTHSKVFRDYEEPISFKEAKKVLLKISKNYDPIIPHQQESKGVISHKGKTPSTTKTTMNSDDFLAASEDDIFDRGGVITDRKVSKKLDSDALPRQSVEDELDYEPDWGNEEDYE
ncbi:hypothetical protein [Paraglaciecola sp. L1A13]|uniref:hypothetical protein n=1 Tax=Paraglaciecola sp. L1A13 TaxID=2686359 RepID=UPI00131DD8CA|nr:hypothetical protein [Paraglaciecola sp. L1A13]